MSHAGLQSSSPSAPLPSRPQSLRRGLVALVGGALLVTLLLMSISVFYFVSRTEEVGWQGRQEEAALRAAETVGVFLQRVTDFLALTGSLDRDSLESDPQMMDELLMQIPALLEIVRLDADGNVVAGSNRDAPLLANLFTIPQSTWFAHASQGKQYLGEVRISSGEEPYLIMAVPAPDGGVAAGRLRMHKLWDVVADIRFGETGQAYVVSQTGQIVAHTDRRVPLANTSLEGRPEMAALSQAPDNAWSEKYVNFAGRPVVGVTAPVPGTNWVVITELPQAEAYAASRTARLLLIVGTVLIGALVMFVTVRLLEYLIFQPMESLRVGAEHIGQGEMSHRIRIGRHDEVGQVAAAFNEMVDRLHEREGQLAARTAALAAEVAERVQAEEALQKAKDELEIRVAERTADLEQRNRQLLALQSAGAAVTSSLDLQHVLETVTGEMANLLDGTACAISKWDQEADTAAVMFEYAPDDWWDDGEIEMEIVSLEDFPLTKRVLVERCIQQVSLSDPDADSDEVAYMQEFDIENLLMLPMIYQDRVVGLVEIMDRSERPPTEQEISLARMLADQAAIAIENARLYEQTQQELSARRQAEARLMRYAAKLEWSNRELQDFAYVASHDLQEPLRKIQAFGDRLEAKHGQSLDERGRDYLARMQNAAGRMQTLINDLLTYSRVTTKAQPFQTVDLEQVARGVVSDLEVRIEQVGGRVEVGDLPTIEADPTQIRQLLQNLISNGLKFHRQDETPIVTVRATCCNGHQEGQAGDSLDDPKFCRIMVEDNGIGFDEKYADRIFQVFQRLHGRGEYEGTGIGLATSRKIAERHGGDIAAKSKPGQGATFIVTLPVRQNKGEETL